MWCFRLPSSYRLRQVQGDCRRGESLGWISLAEPLHRHQTLFQAPSDSHIAYRLQSAKLHSLCVLTALQPGGCDSDGRYCSHLRPRCDRRCGPVRAMFFVDAWALLASSAKLSVMHDSYRPCIVLIFLLQTLTKVFPGPGEHPSPFEHCDIVTTTTHKHLGLTPICVTCRVAVPA